MEFSEQVEAIFPDLIRFARGLAGGVADGDDLLQDALVRAMEGYEKLRDRGSFRFWMFRILSNTHRTQVRRQAWRRWLPLQEAAEAPAPERLSYEDRDAVRRALQDIPRAQRESLVLFEVVGMSIEEIARMQSVTISAVKSRLARGRDRLKESYRHLEVSDDGS